MKTVETSKPRRCDWCATMSDVVYDTPTQFNGKWATLCETCNELHGIMTSVTTKIVVA